MTMMKWNLIGGFLHQEAESVIGGRPCQSRRGGATDEHSSTSRLYFIDLRIKIIWIKSLGSYSDFPTPAYLQTQETLMAVVTAW